MPFEEERLGVIAPKIKTSTRDLIRDIMTLLILLALWVNFGQNRDMQDVQTAGVVRGYILRAVICDQAKAIGASEPQHCDDKVIQPYRDKTIVVGSTAGARASKHTLDVLCTFVTRTYPDISRDSCENS